MSEIKFKVLLYIIFTKYIYIYNYIMYIYIFIIDIILINIHYMKLFYTCNVLIINYILNKLL